MKAKARIAEQQFAVPGNYLAKVGVEGSNPFARSRFQSANLTLSTVMAVPGLDPGIVPAIHVGPTQVARPGECNDDPATLHSTRCSDGQPALTRVLSRLPTTWMAGTSPGHDGGRAAARPLRIPSPAPAAQLRAKPGWSAIPESKAVCQDRQARGIPARSSSDSAAQPAVGPYPGLATCRKTALPAQGTTGSSFWPRTTTTS